MPRQVHDGERSLRAAAMYLQGGMTAPEVAERFGMKLPTLWKAIRKLRAQTD